MDQLHRELCEPVLEEEEEQIIKSEEGGGHIESLSEVDSASSATGSEVGAAGWFTTGLSTTEFLGKNIADKPKT